MVTTNSPTRAINLLLITSLMLNISYVGIRLYQMSREAKKKCTCEDEKSTSA